MIRTIVTWIVGAGLLGCTYTTKIHMEEVENNGGAAGEASTTEESTDTGDSTAAGGNHAGTESNAVKSKDAGD